MEDIDLLEYFLELEVWMRSGEIFLCQRKYTVDILSRFSMMGSMSINTPMVTNLEKMIDYALDLDLVDSTMYMKWIGSFDLLIFSEHPELAYG